MVKIQLYITVVGIQYRLLNVLIHFLQRLKAGGQEAVARKEIKIVKLQQRCIMIHMEKIQGVLIQIMLPITLPNTATVLPLPKVQRVIATIIQVNMQAT